MNDRRGFTLIELLVVIAIIAILAAILFPVFAAVREKARQTTCLSNEKQIGLAVLQYQQDFDEYYPQCTDENYVQWYNMVQPYIKNGDLFNGLSYGAGGVFHCPSFPSTVQGQNYGASDGLFVDNYPGNCSGQPQHPWAMSIVDDPADKIMVTEKGLNGASWGYETFLTLQGWWATSVMTGGVYNPVKDNSAISVGPGYNRDIFNGSSPWEGPRTIRYRHNNAASCLFCDGHVKGMVAGSIKWYENVYIPTVYEKNNADCYSWATDGPY